MGVQFSVGVNTATSASTVTRGAFVHRRTAQSSHAAAAVDVALDDRNLIADAGLVPVLALAGQVGLPQLVVEHLAIEGAANSAGANPAAKVMALSAGMVSGASPPGLSGAGSVAIVQ